MTENLEDINTLICLFHHKDAAQAALEDILKAGIPEANVTIVGGEGSNIETSGFTLVELNVPEKDRGHLLDGLHAGGVLLTVSAISSLAEKVDAIFKAHAADEIDRAVIDDDMSADALPFNDVALDDVILVPEAVSLDGSTRIYRVLTVPTAEPDYDRDPAELGLDARMAPIKPTTDL